MNIKKKLQYYKDMLDKGYYPTRIQNFFWWIYVNVTSLFSKHDYSSEIEECQIVRAKIEKESVKYLN